MKLDIRSITLAAAVVLGALAGVLTAMAQPGGQLATVPWVPALVAVLTAFAALIRAVEGPDANVPTDAGPPAAG